MRLIACLSLLVCVLSVGCARHEYDLTQPPNLAQHIGTKEWSTFTLDTIEYRLRTYDGWLVIQMYNRGEFGVRLSGEESGVVDPKGESHPIQGRSIPAGSFAKLILPPPRPTVRDSGPRFGVGVGVGLSRHDHRQNYGYGPHSDLDHGPRYYTVYDPADPMNWEWTGDNTEARLTLVYHPANKDDKPMEHIFVFRRVKM